LLHEWQGGDREAFDRLLPLVYDELRVIASRRLRREGPRSGHQTTALVNEAYLKLIDQRKVDWRSRAHFFAIAATLMRRIVVDTARRRKREKRGGGVAPISIDEVLEAFPAPTVDVVDILALDRALQKLERIDPDQGRIVELRFFGGLTVEEVALVLGVSAATIKRESAFAKAWLHRALTEGTGV
jgi:RNA polymerase sigma factor (TIGR02999 family)